MKIFKIVLAVLLAVVSALYGVQSLRNARSGKTVGPSITCTGDTLEISVAADRRELLTGVSASDPQDGDLTGKVQVLSISKFITPGVAKITYVVFDSDNNMSTATRQLQYTDYRTPEFAITSPLVYAQNASIDLLGRIRITDVIDGDITHNVRVSSLRTTSDPEVYCVDLQVTNSMGDTASLTLPIICQESSLNRATVQLNNYLVYMDAGSSFRPYSYLTAVETPDGYGLLQDVEISNTVDTSVPGTYMVFYTYRDQSYSGMAVLTVVVQ